MAEAVGNGAMGPTLKTPQTRTGLALGGMGETQVMGAVEELPRQRRLCERGLVHVCV